MYNIDFLPQLEEFRKHLWGAGCVDVQVAAEKASRRGYVPPADVEILPCYEDTNGEWVPYPVKHTPSELEKEICLE